MDDYTPLGRFKIAAQAKRDLREIRCPRDGAVMRVIGSTRESPDSGVPIGKRGSRPNLLTIDVLCPACRRIAMLVSIIETNHPARETLFGTGAERPAHGNPDTAQRVDVVTSHRPAS